MKTGNIVAQTDPGKVREHNEDNHYIHEPSQLVVVADGMGGHNAGEVASQITVDVFREWFEVPHSRPSLELQSDESEVYSVLRHLVAQANYQTFNASSQNRNQAGMGTTLVAAWIQRLRLFFAHVGDSRIYLFRQGILRQITKDHSLVQELVDAGMLSAHEAETDPRRYIIRRAVGLTATVQVDFGQLPLQLGDILLVCTDGLTDMVDHDTMETLLAQSMSELDQACDALMTCALDNGGLDNITIALVAVKECVETNRVCS